MLKKKELHTITRGSEGASTENIAPLRSPLGAQCVCASSFMIFNKRAPYGFAHTQSLFRALCTSCALFGVR